MVHVAIETAFCLHSKGRAVGLKENIYKSEANIMHHKTSLHYEIPAPEELGSSPLPQIIM